MKHSFQHGIGRPPTGLNILYYMNGLSSLFDPITLQNDQQGRRIFHSLWLKWCTTSWVHNVVVVGKVCMFLITLTIHVKVDASLLA